MRQCFSIRLKVNLKKKKNFKICLKEEKKTKKRRIDNREEEIRNEKKNKNLNKIKCF